MKKDKLKELFEANEITKLDNFAGGTGDGTQETNHTNGLQTDGDIGNCDTDTSNNMDVKVFNADDRHVATVYSGDVATGNP